MRETHYIDTEVLEIRHIQEILEKDMKLALSDGAKTNIQKARDYLDEKMDTSDSPIYGVNTGFGSLHNVEISREKLNQLQENLVMSHASGTGDRVGNTIVKLMLLLKVQSLSYGHSGITLEVVQRLIDFYNERIFPIVYEQGSLGASGDLAPLAHMSLPILGKGKVMYKGEIEETKSVLDKLGWEAMSLRSKEGLALLNGTQFMIAHGVYALIKSFKLSHLADVISATSIDAYDCGLAPYNALVHKVRPHKGQKDTAKRIWDILVDSPLIAQEKENVQDPYAFRCVPQVHGASKDTLDFVNKTVETEINSVTDNPNIFVEEDEIISGGNFHGQPLALGLDYMAIALAELGSISERRIYNLVSGKRGLPEFLIDNPGLNNGLMIPQYTAASIVSQNKQLCSPSSVDSITSSNGQEDHVSMGANAATKLLRVVDNLQRILAIELINASQALYFRNLDSSAFVMDFVREFRKSVPIIKEDKIMANEIQKAVEFLDKFEVKM